MHSLLLDTKRCASKSQNQNAEKEKKKKKKIFFFFSWWGACQTAITTRPSGPKPLKKWNFQSPSRAEIITTSSSEDKAKKASLLGSEAFKSSARLSYMCLV